MTEPPSVTIIAPDDQPEPGTEVALNSEHSEGGPGALRQRILKGGLYLAARQGVTVFVGLIGAVVLTRIIGPKDYGLYVALIALFMYMQSVATLGVDAFLVRSEGAVEKRQLDEAFTLLLALSTAVAIVGELLLPVISRFTHLQELQVLGRLTLLALPLVVIGRVPLAKLEHDLEYRIVALVEGAAQILLYIVALPLAVAGWGAAAGILGWLTMQLFVVFAMFAATRYRPTLRLSRGGANSMIRYGFSFSSSIWVWQLRSLVNPLIVARYGGVSAVGMVALATRLVDSLGFVKTATWRLSIAALARVQGRSEKLVSAIEEGMSLQLLALGPLLVVFAFLGRHVLPLAFGPEWLPALKVFPFIAAGALVNATFNVHSSALYVVRRNWAVTKFHLIHIVLFAGAAIILVPIAGVRGYGFAELAALPSYWLIHRGVSKNLGSPRYRVAAVWLSGFAVALFAREIGWWALLGVLAVVTWPGTWRELRRFTSVFRRQPCPAPS